MKTRAPRVTSGCPPPRPVWSSSTSGASRQGGPRPPGLHSQSGGAPHRRSCARPSPTRSTTTRWGSRRPAGRQGHCRRRSWMKRVSPEPWAGPSSSTAPAISRSSSPTRGALLAGAQIAMGQKTHRSGSGWVHAHVELAGFPRAMRASSTRTSRSAGSSSPRSTTRGSRASTSSARPTGPASPSYARPGIIIGRGAEWRSSRTRSDAHKRRRSTSISKSDPSGARRALVAENVALQLQKRVAFRRAMKKCTSALRLGADGIGLPARRLGGRRSRAWWYRDGRVPLSHHPRGDRLRAGRGPHAWRHRGQGVDLQG